MWYRMLRPEMIQVNNVGKCFRLYRRPSDRLRQIFSFGRSTFFEEFWALKDVSFSVKKGETVGIIGVNGSGKSTLLQLICGTLHTSEGTIETKGKVAALLELGAGFSPEFSGIENIYMACALYGLNKKEIEDRLADIVSFADIGEHIHQPVKNYSSGMYVRLGFAIIAHVDADVLIIDEALAVGDAIFTQKCMRFIRSFKETGTLLFVSHDMSSIQNLCEKCIWLDNGRLRSEGRAKEVVNDYLQFTLEQMYGAGEKLEKLEPLSKEEASVDTIPGNGSAEQIDYQPQVQVRQNLENTSGWKTGGGEVTKVTISRAVNENGEAGIFCGGELVRLSIEAIAYRDLDSPILGFLFRDRLGQDLFGENTLAVPSQINAQLSKGEKIRGTFDFYLPMLPNGSYSVMASLANGSLQDHVQHHWMNDALVVEVHSSAVRYGLVGIQFEEVGVTKFA